MNKRMLRSFHEAVLAALIVAAVPTNQVLSEPSKAPPPRIHTVDTVSLISLIANPTGFDHKLIRVYGWLSTGYEDNRLYLSHADADNLIEPNSIYVFFKRAGKEFTLTEMKGLNHKPVLLEGVFEAKDRSINGARIVLVADKTACPNALIHHQKH